VTPVPDMNIYRADDYYEIPRLYDPIHEENKRKKIKKRENLLIEF
jgi:hypothetical protein